MQETYKEQTSVLESPEAANQLVSAWNSLAALRLRIMTSNPADLKKIATACFLSIRRKGQI